jgi:hypothetical protein
MLSIGSKSTDHRATSKHSNVKLNEFLIIIGDRERERKRKLE